MTERTSTTWHRDPVLRVLFLAGVATAGWSVTGPGSGPARSVAAWLVMAALQLVEVALCVAVARLPGLPRSSRRFWRLLAAAAAMFAVGSVAQLPVALHDPGPAAVTGGPAQVTALAVGALFLITAMLTSPLGLSTARERLRFWLDAATVMIAVAIFAWQLADVETSAQSSGTTLTDGLISALFGPAAFLVVAFGAVKLQLGGNAPFTTAAGVLGGVSAALEGLGIALSGPLLAAGRVAPLFGLVIAANLTFAAGVRVQHLTIRADATVLRPRRRRPYSRLPYAAIAATYGLLVWVLTGAGLTTGTWVVLGGAIGSTALVVVRQLTAFADNAELVNRLDAKVRELDEAQQVLHRALADRDRLAGELRHQAFHDSLTGLANRALFRERLDAALTAAGRTGGRVIVLLVDLDDFKPVNDRYGHAVGDTVLRAVAERLTGCLDATDTAARLGGDEFALLLARPGPETVAAAVGRVSAAVCRPVRLDRGEIEVRASIGGAVADGGGREASALLHEADLAMYERKRARVRTA